MARAQKLLARFTPATLAGRVQNRSYNADVDVSKRALLNESRKKRKRGKEELGCGAAMHS
jgi:hypothetical protein